MENQITEKKERQSNFELLRILAMLMIVMHHYSIHGGFDLSSSFSPNVFFVQSLLMFGKMGVNLFVLISGYFLCKSCFKWSKVLRLELQVVFYSVSIGIIFHIINPEVETIKNLIMEFFPIITNKYWFYTTYFVLLLLSPFINILINNMDKEIYKKFIIIMMVIWVFIPLIPKVSAIEMSNLGWFIYLYMVAGYIRKYFNDFNKPAKYYIGFGILGCFILLLSVLFIDLLRFINTSFQSRFAYFGTINSVIIVFSSFYLFIGFSKINIGNKKWINIISSTTFGVYLIHDNNIICSFLWIDLLNNNNYLNTSKLFLHSIISILGVFVVCSIIDLIRQYLFEKPLFFIINKIKRKES